MKISKITFKVQYSIQDKLAIMQQIEKLNLGLKPNQSKEIEVHHAGKKYVCIAFCNSSENLEIYVTTGIVKKEKTKKTNIDFSKHWSTIVKQIQTENNCSYEKAKEIYHKLKNER